MMTLISILLNHPRRSQFGGVAVKSALSRWRPRRWCRQLWWGVDLRSGQFISLAEEMFVARQSGATKLPKARPKSVKQGSGICAVKAIQPDALSLSST